MYIVQCTNDLLQNKSKQNLRTIGLRSICALLQQILLEKKNDLKSDMLVPMLYTMYTLIEIIIKRVAREAHSIADLVLYQKSETILT